QLGVKNLHGAHRSDAGREQFAEALGFGVSKTDSIRRGRSAASGSGTGPRQRTAGARLGAGGGEQALPGIAERAGAALAVPDAADETWTSSHQGALRSARSSTRSPWGQLQS